MSKREYGSVNIDVDIDDIIDQISDDDLAKEIARRRKAPGVGGASAHANAMFDDVRRMLVDGRVDDALTYIDRWRAPKFSDIHDAMARLARTKQSAHPSTGTIQ